jgi:hypothetical protein
MYLCSLAGKYALWTWRCRVSNAIKALGHPPATMTNGRGGTTTRSLRSVYPEVEISRTGRRSTTKCASRTTPSPSTTVDTEPTIPKNQGFLRVEFFAKMALMSDVALSAAEDAVLDRVLASFETLVASLAASAASLAILTALSSTSWRALI